MKLKPILESILSEGPIVPNSFFELLDSLGAKYGGRVVQDKKNQKDENGSFVLMRFQTELGATNFLTKSEILNYYYAEPAIEKSLLRFIKIKDQIIFK